MKLRFILFLFIAFLPLSSFAQQLSSLTLFSEDGEKFTLYLDGEQKNPQPMAEMRVRELSQATYSARIVFANPNLPEFSSVIKTTTPRDYKADVTYKVERNLTGAYTLRCIGVVPIKDNSQVGNNESSYSSTDAADHAQFYDYTKQDKKLVSGSTTDENNITTTTTRVQVNYGEGDITKQNAGCIAMDNRDFERGKLVIATNDMDEQKLAAANDLANSNCFTSDEVLQILNLFSLEKN